MRQILAVGDDNAGRRRRRAGRSGRGGQVYLGEHVDRVVRTALDHPPLVAAPLMFTLVRSGDGQAEHQDDRRPVSMNPSVADLALPARSQVPAQRPRSIRLPSGRLMPVEVASTGRDRNLNVPADIDRAGWWDGSSRIGDPYGTIVVAAHVDSVAGGIGPFAELLRTHPGQRLRLAGATRSQSFEIVSVRLQSRASLSERSPVFSADGPTRLVLITCGGRFDAGRGGYQDNLIVVATPARGLKPIGH